MITIVLLVLAALAFIGAAEFSRRGRDTADMLVGIGLALFALSMLPTMPAPPEPEPEPPAGDYGGIRPHLQGDGVETPGGRGGQLCRVTSRETSGGAWDDGTLAGCLVALPPGCQPRTGTRETCARHVVFDVSGAWDYGNRTLVISGPYLSVWGATAPSCAEGSGSADCAAGAGGVTLQRVQLNVDAAHVYIGHVRIRRSPPSLNPVLTCNFNPEYDCSPVHHHVFDHLSVSWADMRASDGLSGVNNVNGAQASNSSSVLVDSIISEPLWDPPWGGINAAFCGVFARNLLAHGFDRNPIWSGGRCAVYNNLIYNGSYDLAGQALISATSLYPFDRQGRIEPVLRDNVYQLGPTPGGPVDWFLGLYIEQGMLEYGGGAQVFLQGNVGPGITGPTGDGQWTGVQLKQYDTRPNAATAGPGSNVRTDTAPSWFTSRAFEILSNTGTAVRDAVLGNSGARPADRDAADRRIVGDVTEGDGTSYLDWPAIESRYGGQPPIVERTRTCVPPSDPNGPGSRILSDGTRNTRIEDWLENDPQCGARRLERRPE